MRLGKKERILKIVIQLLLKKSWLKYNNELNNTVLVKLNRRGKYNSFSFSV